MISVLLRLPGSGHLRGPAIFGMADVLPRVLGGALFLVLVDRSPVFVEDGHFDRPVFSIGATEDRLPETHVGIATTPGFHVASLHGNRCSSRSEWNRS